MTSETFHLRVRKERHIDREVEKELTKLRRKYSNVALLNIDRQRRNTFQFYPGQWDVTVTVSHD